MSDPGELPLPRNSKTTIKTPPLKKKTQNPHHFAIVLIINVFEYLPHIKCYAYIISFLQETYAEDSLKCFQLTHGFIFLISAQSLTQLFL